MEKYAQKKNVVSARHDMLNKKKQYIQSYICLFIYIFFSLCSIKHYFCMKLILNKTTTKIELNEY